MPEIRALYVVTSSDIVDAAWDISVANREGDPIIGTCRTRGICVDLSDFLRRAGVDHEVVEVVSREQAERRGAVTLVVGQP